MSELISGKDALIALANGGDVIYINTFYKEKPTRYWGDAKECTVEQFFNGEWIFKIEPRTITLNNIEVPCNKSKHDKDDVVWVISTACENWYDWIHGSDCDFNTLYRETEEEIKQVVSALRSVFKGGV